MPNKTRLSLSTRLRMSGRRATAAAPTIVLTTGASPRTLTITGATGGTYRIREESGWNGSIYTQITTSTALAHNAAAATIQTACQFFNNAPTVTGNAGGPYTLTGIPANVASSYQVSIASNLLT